MRGDVVTVVQNLCMCVIEVRVGGSPVRRPWWKWSIGGVVRDPTGPLQIPWMFKHCLDELAKQPVHVALPSRVKALQETNVAAVGCNQQRNIGQALG